MKQETKFCPSCEKDLPLSSGFYIQKRGDDPPWIHRQCKSCEKKNITITRDKKREFILAYAHQKGCVDCGEDDPVLLEFDHVRGDKVTTVCQMAAGSFSLKRIMLEIEKCEVRCANCHRKRTAHQCDWYSRIDLEALDQVVLPASSDELKYTSPSKLTPEQVLEIRAKHETGNYTYQQLADEYAMHVNSIAKVIRRHTWDHL